MEDVLVQIFAYDSLDLLMDKYTTLTTALDKAHSKSLITKYESTIYIMPDGEGYLLEFVIWSETKR